MGMTTICQELETGKNVHCQHYTQRVKTKVELKSSIPIGAIIDINLKGFTLGAKAKEQ
jgi:hypothetical protein